MSKNNVPNVYKNYDYYKSHVDNSYSTALTWFYKEPKQFEGGNILFSDYNIEIPIENNSILILKQYFNKCI